jgi:hypothetical protein
MHSNWLVDLELFTTCYTKLDKKQGSSSVFCYEKLRMKLCTGTVEQSWYRDIPPLREFILKRYSF